MSFICPVLMTDSTYLTLYIDIYSVLLFHYFCYCPSILKIVFLILVLLQVFSNHQSTQDLCYLCLSIGSPRAFTMIVRSGIFRTNFSYSGETVMVYVVCLQTSVKKQNFKLFSHDIFLFSPVYSDKLYSRIDILFLEKRQCF